MAAITNWTFRGTALNSGNTKITGMTGFSNLPPLHGANWIAQNATGEQFVPKLHGGRDIAFAIEVLDVPTNSAQALLDTISTYAANRVQGNLVYTDSASVTRTGQAECTGWTPVPGPAGSIFAGLLTFHLADPWLYGPTVSGSVTPNAGIAFDSTAAKSNISGPRTTWSASVVGVTSGQPILVAHYTQGYTTVLTSIADTFGGHYTYVKIDGNNTGTQNVELYIGTGGTGTSGTVTVTAPSGLIGGFVWPMVGASTGVGLAIIDVHGNQSGTAPAAPTLTLTPTASFEAACFVSLGAYPNFLSWPTGPGWFANDEDYLGAGVGWFSGLVNPTNGVAIPASGWRAPTGTATWQAVGAIIKGSGAAVTLNVTNPGTALAEKLTLDFLGPIANPTITNMTNGTSVTINATVAGTKHLIVDTGAFTALNDGTNVIGSVAHSGATPFLTLNPGLNALQISGAACTGATLVTVSFAPPWV